MHKPLEFSKETVHARVYEYCAEVEKLIADHHKKLGYKWEVVKVTPMFGPKFVRIVKNAYSVSREGVTSKEATRSVHTFVNLENGDIHKAAGWKAPEKKNVRANVYDPDHGRSGITEHGAVYLR